MLGEWIVEALKDKQAELSALKSQELDNIKLYPCPYSTAVRCVLTDSCYGCETFGKYLVGEEIPRFKVLNNIAEELSALKAGEKKEDEISTESFRYGSPDGFRIDFYEDNSILRKRGVGNLFCHPEDLGSIKKVLSLTK